MSGKFADATETMVRGASSKPLSALVRVLGAPADPPAFRLAGGRCVVGSASDCDIVIAHPTVSRNHVELALVAEGVAVTDLGSRNGTFFLGQRIEKMVASLGASLEVGGVRVAIDPDTDALAQGELYLGASYRGIVGTSLVMRRLFSILARLEGSLVTVLVDGESGVGKELVAAALHEGSHVASGPLVVVNCGAIPRDLVASELFGHRKGAFTGAQEARKGAFENADGGTLFLDEIGELPLELQPMLLRALEAGEIRTVGGDQPRRVRVRVVAATNRDLEAEVAAGRFREDLYYRLAVVRVRVPTLRERPDDVPALAARFAEAVGVAPLPDAVVDQLTGRTWPGNVRELKNAVQAYAAIGVVPAAGRTKGAMLDVAHAELVDLARPYAAQKEELSERFTRTYLELLMRHTNGNQTVAARLAGLDRSYLGRLLVKHGLGKP